MDIVVRVTIAVRTPNLNPRPQSGGRGRETDQDRNRQTRDPSTRYTQLDNGTYGHITWANDPASRLTELDDIIDMGYAGPSVRIRDVLSTTSGPFCYFYEESP